LERVLWGYAAQCDRDFEIVIADDGSTNETRITIARFCEQTPLVIRHVWHPDEGFRKCAILNRAIQAATSEYLIFSDGDCIPRCDFVSTHRALLRPRQMLSGGLIRLPLDLSRQITHADILAGRHTDPAWLLARGVQPSFKLWKLSFGQRWAALWDRLTTTRASWNGHNSSGWKRDLLSVNGFDERMEYGGEDRELGERLLHSGVRAVQIRHRAICAHLEHARGYVSNAAWAKNRAIWNETLRTKSTWTNYGITEHLPGDLRRAAA
jgi:glycosyltransferase involved in cell wall biosynthesis